MNAIFRFFCIVTQLALIIVCDSACSPGSSENTSSNADPTFTGRWYPANPTPLEDDIDTEAIEALGYLGATLEATETSGISAYDEEYAHRGLNLFVSGHAPKAFLLDMNGNILHEWERNAKEVWPDLPITDHGGLKIRDAITWVPGQDETLIAKFPKKLAQQQSRGYSFWRRAHLYPNGDLLAIFINLGAVKMDKNSKVLWATAFMSHHDLDVAPDGRIYVLGKKIKEDSRMRADGVTVDDTIVVLSPDGTQEREFSIGEAFLRSPYAPTIWTRPGEFDLLHTNTIEVLDGRLADKIPAFKKGNVLISCLKRDTIAVVDMETETVVWALSGMFDNMHQPTVLDNGNILVFDNHGNNDKSRVFEFDPLTQQIPWMYAPTPNTLFDSNELGSAQRLPNNNTLVTESTRGRVFELTPDNKIVWEHLNPHRGGKDDRLVAATLEIVRYPESYAESWLSEQ